MNIQTKWVKNYTQGRYGYAPEAIVIHIAQGSLEGAYSWFNDSTSQASSHYMVGKNGDIWQFVADLNIAWHAGYIQNPSWNLLKSGVNPNFYTIGIEHEGFTGEAWNDQMYAASSELVGTLCRTYNIPLDRDHIIGHYQINSVNRNNCPGTGVDFTKLINLALNFYEDPKMIKELQDKISALQSQINALNTDKKNLQTQVDNLNAQLKAKDQSALVTELRTQNAKLSQEIASMQKSEQKLNSQINELKKENEALKANKSSGGSIGGFLGGLFDKISGR